MSLFVSAGILDQVVEIRECVVAWLEATGKTQTAVAKRGGLDPDKLSKMATGANTNPRWETIVKLAKGFGLEPSAFLAGPHARIVAANGHASATVEASAVSEPVAAIAAEGAAMEAATEAARDAIALATSLTRELAHVRAQLRRCEARTRQP